jgi:PAS domain S-box-containing protein
VVNRDSKTDPRTADFFEKTYCVNNELAYITVPMLRGGKWVASLWCSDDKARNWTTREVAVVENIAERAWSAVEKLRTEDLVRRNQEMFSTLVDAAPFGVYFIDSDFRLISVNKGAQAVFSGIEPLIGRDFAEVLRLVWTEPFASEALEKFRNTLRTGEPYLSPTITEYRLGEDRTETYDWQIHRIMLSDGSFGVVCYFYDLTHQKRLEGEVRRTAAMDAYRLKLADALRPLADPHEIQLKAACVLGEYLSAERVGYAEDQGDGRTVAVKRNYTNGVPGVEGTYSYEDYGSDLLSDLRSGKTVVRSDVQNDAALTLEQKQAHAALQMGAIANMPLLKEGRLVAILFIHYREPHAWSKDELALLEETAERTWAAVDRAKGIQRERDLTKQLETIINGTPFMLTRCGRDLRYKYASAAYARMVGLSQAEIAGRPIVEVLGEDAFRTIEPYVEEVLEGKAVQYESKLDLANGERRHLTVAYLPDISETGEVIGWVASIVDITERTNAEKALRDSEERFRLATEAVQAVIYDWNIPEDTIQRSGEIEPLLGFGPFDPESKTNAWWRDRIHPEDRRQARELVDRAIGSEQMRFEDEYRILHRDGTYKWVSDIGQFIRDAKGRAVRCVGSVTDITDRKRAEEALHESRERLRLAQYAGNIGVWDWDQAADNTYWSETMWKIYGEAEAAEAPDDAFWTRHLHEDDREGVKLRLESVLSSDENSYRDEFRIRTGEREIKWIEAIATIMRAPDGRATRMYGVNIDITERKLAQERILRSEDQLRLVTNSLPALIAYMDQNLRYRFVNERYNEWFDLKTDDILGKRVRDVIGARAYDVVKPSLTAALNGEEVSIQTTLNYKRAGRRFVQVSYIPDVSEDGSVRGIFSLVNDLTAWKESQDLLRSSEKRLALMMESVSDYAIFSMDADGKIETWNDGAVNILGYSASEVVGRSASRFFPEEGSGENAAEAEMRTARRRGKASDERWLVKKDGTRFYASGVLMPIRVGRKLNGFVKIISDLTERKLRAELLQSAHDELESRVRDRTRDLAEVNEALRNEIAERERSEAVKIGLLQRIVSAQETERQRIARDIHDQLGQRLTALRLKLAALRSICGNENGEVARVERLQEIAHLLDSEVSFLASELRPNTLDDLGLEAALRAHAADWSRHYDVKLEFHSMGQIARTLGRDTEIQLYRIAQEALNNVAKHAQATQVDLLLEQTADSLVLIIEDNGIGFDEEARIGPSGRGMGLIGMNERASLIGATIEIESEKGTGTTIFVRLPLKGRTEEK